MELIFFILYDNPSKILQNLYVLLKYGLNINFLDLTRHRDDDFAAGVSCFEIAERFRGFT
jgi:hypothetical protein